jgi:hypothetical protein
MRTMLCCATAVIALSTAAAFAEDPAYPAKLVSHAILPAASFVKAPETAPQHLQVSGKFTTADRKRADGLGTVPGKDGVRLTGLSVPFDGQPLQGFSGIRNNGDGTFWTLSDNGFGSKINSTDSALMLHLVAFDWDNGKVEVKETVNLTDPDRKAPFPIVLEGAAERYLTGGDFDVESIQPVADGFWVGEEFGPFLLKFDRQGKLQEVFETMVDGQPVRSPDHPAIVVPANPAAKMPAFNLKRSGGYEGLAMSKDGSKLYGMLEGPLYTADAKVEQLDGATVLRIIEFDTTSKAWTGRTWLYPLAEGGEAIGDFNMIDETTALVIERDNGAGVAAKACAKADEPKPDCFAKPSKVKRIYKIEMNDANVGKAVRKIGHIDLLAIADPDNKRRQGGSEGIYDMPFLTIENVDVVDATHIIVGNDNNLPFSAGRFIDKADDNEFVILEVGEFLAAK